MRENHFCNSGDVADKIKKGNPIETNKVVNNHTLGLPSVGGALFSGILTGKKLRLIIIKMQWIKSCFR